MTPYVVLSAILFAVGAVGLLVRRDPLVMIMSIEIMWNAANLLIVAAARFYGTVSGQALVFLVITLAAADVAIGLAIVMHVARRGEAVDVDALKELKG
ncbi:MAG TPA: NADH-quinone oxidoreductase subunit NuoK [Bacillota bacterium]|nr:NADH-quinone oxidoreductase subunit NuoK [Bacillota bacterium]